MAFTRAWQYPFGLNFTQPRNQILDGNKHWSQTGTLPYTGNYCMRAAGQRDGIGYAWDTALANIRGNFILKYEWTYPDAYLLRTYVYDQTAPGIEVRIMAYEFRADLYIDGVKVDEVSLTGFPQLLMNLQFVSVGFFIEGGTRFLITVNGQTLFDYVNINVPATTDAVFICGNISGAGWYGYIYLDDIYFDDAAGEVPSIPPTYRFLTSGVNGDGTNQDWAAYGGGLDYQQVDDLGVDDDATHIWINATAQTEMFNVANPTIPDGYSITAAIPHWVGRRGQANQASQIQGATFDGVFGYGTAKDLPLWYTEMFDRFPLDPSGMAWSSASFNAAEFGFRTQGVF